MMGRHEPEQTQEESSESTKEEDSNEEQPQETSSDEKPEEKAEESQLEEIVEEKEETPAEEQIEPVVEEKVEEETLVQEEKAEDVETTEEAPLDEAPVEEPQQEEEVTEEAPVQEEAEPVVEEEATEPEEVQEESTEELEAETEDAAEAEEAEEEIEELEAEEDEPKAKPVKKVATKKTAIVPVKKGRTYNGKYEVYQTADGYAYQLKASNGEILVTSETYASKDGVLKAIDAVKKNLETGTVKIFPDKRGKYQFKLISKNYRTLAISANYNVEKSAIRASESFKKFALKADIVDIELPDNDAAIATPIEITAKPDDKQGGKFVYEEFNGEFGWELRASNGQILCQMDGYTSKKGCMNSIDKFKENVASGTFKCVQDKAGRYQFKLYSQAGRICAVGESYSTKQSAEGAANSVVSFSNAPVVEEKPKKK